MNIRFIINMLGRTVLIEAGLLILPIIVALCYGEPFFGFAVTLGIAAVVGSACILVKPKSKTLFAKEGFIICALSWIVISLIGAVPFVIEKWIPNYIDAVFEIVSGFTTTGATVMQDYTNAGHYALFFWRTLSHFIGGMGVLVFILAIMPPVSERSIHIMRAEVPGTTVGKLVPRMKKTALILYAIYAGLTFIEFILLLFSKDMSFFEALTHALSTAGTGGFSNRAGSIGEFSPYVQYVIAVFMLLFAINFNLYYFILIGQWRQSAKNEELHWYLIIVAACTIAVTLNIRHLFATFEESFRTALFQVAALVSSTGFGTVDLVKLPMLSQIIFVLLMFSGACAGSTGGGLKLSRVMIVLKSISNEFKRLLRPREVVVVRMDKKPLPTDVVRSAIMIFCMYMVIIGVSMFIVAFDGFDFAKTSTSVISCMGNMGPALWSGSCFADFSWYSKIVLAFDMLMGRLEIIPILMLFVPSVWKYRHQQTQEA